jgi:hypothetical protein
LTRWQALSASRGSTPNLPPEALVSCKFGLFITERNPSQFILRERGGMMLIPRLVVATVTAGLRAATPGKAKFRIYDGQRAAAAQEAKKAADQIKSGNLFKKQAQNLRLLAENELIDLLSIEV